MFKRQKRIKTLFLFLFVMGMLFLPTVSSQAATKRVSASTEWKKAPKCIKGTNLVTAKKNNSYLRFQAPSKGTYKFTISNVVTIPKKEKDYALGNFYVFKKNKYGYLQRLTDMKTNYGIYSFAHLATIYSYNRNYKSQIKNSSTYLASRYLKVSLKAGETLWMQYYHTGGGSTYRVTISK